MKRGATGSASILLAPSAWNAARVTWRGSLTYSSVCLLATTFASLRSQTASRMLALPVILSGWCQLFDRVTAINNSIAVQFVSGASGASGASISPALVAHFANTIHFRLPSYCKIISNYPHTFTQHVRLNQQAYH